MWDAVRQILKGTTLYYKQFNFFAALAVVAFGGYFSVQSIVNYTAPQAATEIAQQLHPTKDTLQVAYEVGISSDGDVRVDAIPVNGAFTFTAEQRHFLLVLTRDSPVYIGSVEATVRLPKASPSARSLEPRIFGIHGVNLSSYQIVDDQTISFQATDVPEGATVSIGLTFPGDYFQDSWLNKVRESAVAFSPGLWLAIGIVLPALTVLFLLVLVARKWISNFRVRNSAVSSALPSSVPPGVIGALFHGRIGAKVITATLFDLAQRGFVDIYHGKGDEVAFSKGSNLFTQKTTTLRPFEIFLLHQIFGDEGFIARQDSIRVGLESELFSSKIAMTMVNLYDSLVGEGYFLQSPNRYYLKYKITGMTLFFVAAMALLYGSFVLPEPAFVLFLWAGMIVAALLTVWITPGLPRRTKYGDKTLRDWLAFRNYLTDSAPVIGEAPSLFFTYLPYAIVLDCEQEWIARWRNETLVLPHWFSANETPQTADDYAKSLVSIIEYLSGHLFTSRPPSLA